MLRRYGRVWLRCGLILCAAALLTAPTNGLQFGERHGQRCEGVLASLTREQRARGTSSSPMTSH